MRKTVTTIGGLDGEIDCCIFGLDESSGIGDIGDSEDDPLYEDVISDFDPTFVPNTPDAQSIPEPGPGGSLTLKGKGWSLGDGSYIVQSGDTLAGLSRLYLGDAGRFQEIWRLQSTTYRSARSPDNIQVGDRLAMPDEAVANARLLKVFPASSTANTVATAPPKTTTAPPATVPPKTATPKTTSNAAIGLGAAALAAGLFLFARPVPPPPPPQSQRRRRSR